MTTLISHVVSIAKNNSFAGGLIGGRDNTNATILAFSSDPSVTNPFQGEVSSTGGVNFGLGFKEPSTILGEQVYEGLTPSVQGLVVGKYYYKARKSTNVSPTMINLSWMEFMGENEEKQFDNAKNEIIYESIN